MPTDPPQPEPSPDQPIAGDGKAGDGSAAGQDFAYQRIRPRPRPSTVAWRVAMGVLLSLALSVGLLLVLFRGRGEILTAARLEQAEQLWHRNAIASYDQDLELIGSQAGKIHVEVRQGEVTKMVRNGYQPKQQRTWSYWSVPGQFETIEVDLIAAQHPEQGFGVAPGTEAIIRAEFDPVFGYPRFYQRLLLGTAIHVEWRVTNFQVIHD